MRLKVELSSSVCERMGSPLITMSQESVILTTGLTCEAEVAATSETELTEIAVAEFFASTAGVSALTIFIFLISLHKNTLAKFLEKGG